MAHTHHGIDYIEIPAPDLAAAQQFYGDAFGWRFTDPAGNRLGVWSDV